MATPKKNLAVDLEPSISRKRSTGSISGTKKKGGSSSRSSANSSPAPSAVATKAKDGKIKGITPPEFVDPPKIIGDSPLRQGSVVKESTFASPAPVLVKKSKKSAALHKASRRRAKAEPSRFITLVRLCAAASLITYTTVICPHDKNGELALCSTERNAEEFWNRHIYGAYLEPRFHAIITSHPSIARFVEQAGPIVRQVRSQIHHKTEPLYHAYIDYSTLAGHGLQRYSRPYVKQLQQQYDAHIDPYISGYVIPPYNQHVLPTLAKLEAFGKVAGARIEPYLWHTAALVHAGFREAQPYLVVLGGYAADVPRMIRQRAWEPLVDMRRTYVDPHVSKMMETVDEVGGEAQGMTEGYSEVAEEPKAEQAPGDEDDAKVEDVYVT